LEKEEEYPETVSLIPDMLFKAFGRISKLYVFYLLLQSKVSTFHCPTKWLLNISLHSISNRTFWLSHLLLLLIFSLYPHSTIETGDNNFHCKDEKIKVQKIEWLIQSQRAKEEQRWHSGL
jgi:hypothetical protein